MEPVTTAGDQISGAAVPLVQWQFPNGTSAVPCPLDRKSGLVRHIWIPIQKYIFFLLCDKITSQLNDRWIDEILSRKEMAQSPWLADIFPTNSDCFSLVYCYALPYRLIFFPYSFKGISCRSNRSLCVDKWSLSWSLFFFFWYPNICCISMNLTVTEYFQHCLKIRNLLTLL